VGPGREANHSRPSSAEIKNTGALPPVFYEWGAEIILLLSDCGCRLCHP
jgi:hypothetical protein